MCSHAQSAKGMQGVDGKRFRHNPAGKEKQANHKTAAKPQTILWQPQSRRTHIKRENRKTRLKQTIFDLLLNKGAGVV